MAINISMQWYIIDLSFNMALRKPCIHAPDLFLCDACKQHKSQLLETWFNDYDRQTQLPKNFGIILTIFNEERSDQILNVLIRQTKIFLDSKGVSTDNIKYIATKMSDFVSQEPIHDILRLDFALRAKKQIDGRLCNKVWNNRADTALYFCGKPKDKRLNIIKDFSDTGNLHKLTYSLWTPESPHWQKDFISIYMNNYPAETLDDAKLFIEQHAICLDYQGSTNETSDTRKITKQHLSNMPIEVLSGLGNIQNYFDHGIYQKSCVRIVVETHPGSYTEKTWNSIMNCMPFFYFDHDYDYFTKLGFQTYNDYVSPGIAEQAIKDSKAMIECVTEFFDAAKNKKSQIQEVINYNLNHYEKFCYDQEQKLIEYVGEDFYKQNWRYLLNYYW